MSEFQRHMAIWENEATRILPLFLQEPPIDLRSMLEALQIDTQKEGLAPAVFHALLTQSVAETFLTNKAEKFLGAHYEFRGNKPAVIAQFWSSVLERLKGSLIIDWRRARHEEQLTSKSQISDPSMPGNYAKQKTLRDIAEHREPLDIRRQDALRRLRRLMGDQHSEE
jgi:hypothetical protein